VTVGSTPLYVWGLVVPAILVWAVTVLDVLRRPGLSNTGRLAWVVAVTVVFPTALAWHLIRPVAPPAPVPLGLLDSQDRRVQLVQLVLARRRGEVEAEHYHQGLARLLPPG
jgi:hypothetical protein